MLLLCVSCLFIFTRMPCVFFFFFFNDTATTEIYTLSLHDALPICHVDAAAARVIGLNALELAGRKVLQRSEEHTSELQSPCNLVCRLLLEKKKKQSARIIPTYYKYHTVSTWQLIRALDSVADAYVC